MNIVAVDIPDDWSDSESAELSSVASLLTADDELMTATLWMHQQSNAEHLARRFPMRLLDELGFMCTHSSDNKVHASSLRYRFLNPLVYRQESLLRTESFDHFVSFIRANSQFKDDEYQRLWNKVSTDSRTVIHLNTFEPTNEGDLNNWIVGLCHRVMNHLPADSKISSQNRFGISGALAYTDPESFGENDQRAAYLGKCDLVVFKKSKVFAVMQLKMVSDNQIWYRHGAILPQIICWIGGTFSARVGIVLSNIGYRIIYRILRPQPDERGNAVFDFYILIDGVDPNSQKFTICVGDVGVTGRQSLLRIIFEILVSTMIEPTDGEALKSEIQTITPQKKGTAHRALSLNNDCETSWRKSSVSRSTMII